MEAELGESNSISPGILAIIPVVPADIQNIEASIAQIFYQRLTIC
jgi:hypothetical protein